MLVTPASAPAESYPERPITLIVPLAPGGSTDVIARILAKGLQTSLGRPVAVENITGAGGSLGIGRLTRAPPDGYTIGIGHWGTNVANGAIYSLQYDVARDVEPVALIATQPLLIVAKKSVPADDLKELIGWLKANAAHASEGNSGNGTPTHVAGIMFQRAIGASLQMIPYRSAGQSMQALIAGDIDVLLDTPAVSMPYVRSGAIKAYAVTAENRLAIAPKIPTTDEAGLPGFHFSFWHALFAPRGTPRQIIAKLNEATRRSLADPAIRAQLTDLAQEIFPPERQTPEALADLQMAEIGKWWPIIKSMAITAREQ